MTILRVPLLAAVIVALALSGCDQNIHRESLLTTGDVSFIPIVYPDEVNPALRMASDPDPEWADEYRSGQQRAMQDLGTLRQHMSAGATPLEIHEFVEELISRYAGTELEAMVAQHASHRALAQLVRVEETSAEHLVAIESHTMRLLHWNHPYLPVILDGIALLDGYWSDERRAAGIERAHAAATNWLATNPCDSCLGEGPHVSEAVDARDVVIIETSNSISEARARLARLGIEIQ